MVMEKPYCAREAKVLKKYERPLNEVLRRGIGASGKLSAEFYKEALEMARLHQDATILVKLGQIADKEDRDELVEQQMSITAAAKEKIAEERAERLRIENDIKRGAYVDRSSVKLVMSRVYAVHTGQLQPIGLKLADHIDSIPPSPDRRFKIQKEIDKEVYNALSSIQRILIEWLTTGKE